LDTGGGIGLKMLTKFLTDDEGNLKDDGAIYDETGSDGLPPDEPNEPEGTEKRNK